MSEDKSESGTKKPAPKPKQKVNIGEIKPSKNLPVLKKSKTPGDK